MALSADFPVVGFTESTVARCRRCIEQAGANRDRNLDLGQRCGGGDLQRPAVGDLALTGALASVVDPRAVLAGWVRRQLLHAGLSTWRRTCADLLAAKAQRHTFANRHGIGCPQQSAGAGGEGHLPSDWNHHPASTTAVLRPDE